MITTRPSFPDRGPDGLSPEQLAILKEPIRIPTGYGLSVVGGDEKSRRLANLEADPGPRDTLQVWEPPRRGFLYIVTADISSGLQQDNSVVEVTRVGTLRECDEQVAQFVSNSVDETDMAYVIDAVGRFYAGRDGQPARVAIECNGMGISTQNELIKHIGYTNLFIWEYIDAVEGHELTTRYGWYTNQRTRPMILQAYLHAIKSVDPHTGLPDYRINSPWTMQEMADFQSPGPLWLAEAVDGAHDDCILAGAIGAHISRNMGTEMRETMHDARRRLSAEMQRLERKQDLLKREVSFQSTDATHDEMMGRDDWSDEDGTAGGNPFSDVEHIL